MTVDELVKDLGAVTGAWLEEYGLQGAIAKQLQSGSQTVEREYRLSDRDRIDFFIPIDRIGIEVKVTSPAVAVRRQLARYAGSHEIDQLILVTTVVAHRALHGLVLDGVPVRVVIPSWL